ncbi:MAG: type I glyceraldehyde-3-phosphate dehydrogenase, partial [Bacteroidales bacterium]|nr:type I glyceraldehyde-3-phosphate dehydrogenase [Bacteroidales bacterium]
MGKIKVGINGFGRIGRLVFRVAAEMPEVEVVAINDLIDVDYIAYMLKYDSTHGRFNGTIEVKDGNLVVNGNTVRVTAERNPADLKWDAVGAEYVVDATGLFLTKEKVQGHIDAGAKKVIMSAPSKDDTPMFVMGVNHKKYSSDMNFVSNASCTTNCLAPVAKVLNDLCGIESGFMTTIHAYTSDQRLQDQAHSDMRRARAAAVSLIPTSTGAAKAVGLVMPELNGKLDGSSIRVPTPNVSLVDFTFDSKKKTSIEEINETIKAAAEGPMKGIIEYVTDPIVSSDVIHNPHSSIFDSNNTLVVDGDMIKCTMWYDNEWGYS